MSIISAVSSLIAMFSDPVVAIISPKTGEVLFEGLEIMKANVNASSKIMDHPLENGSPVSDYLISLPIEMDLLLVVAPDDFGGIYSRLQAMRKAGYLLTVRTNAKTYGNLIIASAPHEETPEVFGMLTLTVKLREVQRVTVNYQALQPTQVEKPTDQSTVKTGEKQGQGSVLHDLTKTLWK